MYKIPFHRMLVLDQRCSKKEHFLRQSGPCRPDPLQDKMMEDEEKHLFILIYLI